MPGVYARLRKQPSWHQTPRHAPQAGSLQDDLLTSAYTLRLNTALSDLNQWCLYNRLLSYDNDLYAGAPDVQTANSILIRYIQAIFEAGRPLSDATHAVIALQRRYPGLRGHLRRAWDSVLSWKLKTPLQMRAPVTLPILQVLFLTGLCQGLLLGPNHEAAFKWVAGAILLRVAFFGLLRPVEVCSLLREDFVLPSEVFQGFGHRAAMLIRRPKNRRFSARCQFATITDACTIAWLEWFLKGVPSHAKAWPLTTSSLRGWFKALLKAADLADLPYVPASLRAGGTTHFFLEGIDASTLRFMGRWRSLDSLEHYIQEAIAVIIMSKLSDVARANIAQTLECIQQHQLLPPAAPWQAFLSRQRQLRAHQRWITHRSSK
jgi:hypothetical protein